MSERMDEARLAAIERDYRTSEVRPYANLISQDVGLLAREIRALQAALRALEARVAKAEAERDEALALANEATRVYCDDSNADRERCRSAHRRLAAARRRTAVALAVADHFARAARDVLSVWERTNSEWSERAEAAEARRARLEAIMHGLVDNYEPDEGCACDRCTWLPKARAALAPEPGTPSADLPGQGRGPGHPRPHGHLGGEL